MQTVTHKKFQHTYFSFGSKKAPSEVLQFKGFFEPIIKVDEDLPANLYGIPANIEEIIMQTYSGYSLDIKAIQTPPTSTIEDTKWTRYNGAIYVTERRMPVTAVFFWIQHLQKESILPAPFRFFATLSFEECYKETSKQVITGIWPLINGLYTSAKEIDVDIDRYDPASIYFLENGKFVSQGYHALQELGLNLEKKQLVPP